MYDPVLGRFLSPDPFVQAPDFSQNFNRYSYCLNNPLKYTDPSGGFGANYSGMQYSQHGGLSANPSVEVSYPLTTGAYGTYNIDGSDNKERN
jgi:hypothetical protein